ncbi:hypothetical protein C8F01DRAFT_1080531 [Mycena amicta]|nr:hypothetical protein C8F01DRAFT_1080531 [Mycena amicta]
MRLSNRLFASAIAALLVILLPTDAAATPAHLPLQTALPVAGVACNSTTNICFDVYAGRYMTLGFALPPPHSKLHGEMMIFSAFPLPYGYVGAVPGNLNVQQLEDSKAQASAASGLHSLILWWIDKAKRNLPGPRDGSYPSPSDSETLIVESAIPKQAANGTQILSPLSAINIQTSPIASGNATHAVHIFRCQQCTSLATAFSTGSAVVNVTMIYSRSAPQPVSGTGSDKGLAVLPLANSETETFQVVVKQAQFEDYEVMLKTARLV